MEDSKKKPVMIVIVIACLAAAGLITWLTHGSANTNEALRGQMTLLLCRNPQCKASFEMDSADYAAELSKLPGGFQVPGVPCQKCGKNSAYPAVKCPKCSLVFEAGAAGIDKLADTCPSCGFSARANRGKTTQ